VRCAGCGSDIVGRFVKPGGKTYHPDCFKCSSCRGSLAAGYIERDSQTLCGDCAKKSAPKPTTSSTTTAAPVGASGGIRFDHRTGQLIE